MVERKRAERIQNNKNKKRLTTGESRLVLRYLSFYFSDFYFCGFRDFCNLKWIIWFKMNNNYILGKISFNKKFILFWWCLDSSEGCMPMWVTGWEGRGTGETEWHNCFQSPFSLPVSRQSEESRWEGRFQQPNHTSTQKKISKNTTSLFSSNLVLSTTNKDSWASIISESENHK